MDAITLLLGALATARLTRLVTRDRITHGARRWALKHLDHEGLTAYLIVCDWCTSIYLGAVVAAVGAWAGLWTWGWVLPLCLAFSYVAGWLASQEGE